MLSGLVVIIGDAVSEAAWLTNIMVGIAWGLGLVLGILLILSLDVGSVSFVETVHPEAEVRDSCECVSWRSVPILAHPACFGIVNWCDSKILNGWQAGLARLNAKFEEFGILYILMNLCFIISILFLISILKFDVSMKCISIEC